MDKPLNCGGYLQQVGSTGIRPSLCRVAGRAAVGVPRLREVEAKLRGIEPTAKV
jgi:hypothetical protein